MRADATDEIPQRYSIAISGGASLGAYEAGVNWGVLKAFREYPEEDPVLGGRIRPLELASIAGASAGGINSLLSGLVWCLQASPGNGVVNDIDNNLFRDLWFSPDINRLLPPEADSSHYLSDDGVLSRSDLIAAARALRKTWHSPVFRSGCRVPIGVTVTRVEPETTMISEIEVTNQRFVIPFELRVQPDNTVAFYYDPSDYRSLRERSMILIPYRRSDPRYMITDQAVEDVIFTTSAYPIAFGRKRLKYCRLRTTYMPTGDKQPGANGAILDGGQWVCPSGYELAEAEFADGGLFDNIPIGLARTLAESNAAGTPSPLAVVYAYIDPDRLRFDARQRKSQGACERPDPPAACEEMEFGLRSQAGPLVDAIGTARTYELYRELTSDFWALNMAGLSFELAKELGGRGIKIDCRSELSLFERQLDCVEALQRAGLLLQIAYERIEAPITQPYSLEKLRQAGIIERCRKPRVNFGIPVSAECAINFLKYRSILSEALIKILRRAKVDRPDLERRIRQSLISIHNDRVLRVSSRGAPLTGSLLDDFGAFLEKKFREYDYYVGVYDATILLARNLCGMHLSAVGQAQALGECTNAMAHRLHRILGIDRVPRARYVFALLARDEFGAQGQLAFAYDPLPPEDRDMRIIHEGLAKVLKAGDSGYSGRERLFAVEKEFFAHLKANGFKPTPTADGSKPLLAQIIEDPDQWSYEFVQRATDRLVYLEEQAERILAQREPDPEKRTSSWMGGVAGGSYLLRTATYKYPAFDFAPSTAPRSWVWRHIIPYELGFDLIDRDFQLTWQPTWAISSRTNLGIRATIGFAEGLIEFEKGQLEADREDYFAMGLDFTRLTGRRTVSGWGITPTYYRTFDKPADAERDTLGFDIHVGLFKNRLRIGVGMRDVNDGSESWFLLVGISDFPGLMYWSTR